MEDKVVKRGQWLMRETLFGMLSDRISNSLCDYTQCKICRGAQPCIGVNLKKVGLEDLDGGKEKRKVQLS